MLYIALSSGKRVLGGGCLEGHSFLGDIFGGNLMIPLSNIVGFVRR